MTSSTAHPQPPRPRAFHRIGCALSLFAALLQPLQVLAAPITDPLAPTLNGPRIERTATGVPILQINRPNGNGISVNPLPELNTDALGIIFNNATQAGNSLLGGNIAANPNLGQSSATTIVAEILGPLPSQLNGPIEVFGRPAWTLIANPNGITCNGCGILNAPRFSLAAGRVEWRDAQGNLIDPADATTFTLNTPDNSRIHLERAGLEGTRAQIDLIAGQITLDGDLRAGNGLSLRAGGGIWKPDGSFTPAPSSNTTHNEPLPGYKIDATAFGAISAGQIDILVTGLGAGVRSAADLAARGQDLTIRADGHIELATNYAERDLTIRTEKGGVRLADTTAKGQLTIDADGRIHSTGVLESAKDLSLTSRQGDIDLEGRTLTESRLTLNAGRSLTTRGALLSGGTLNAQAGYKILTQGDIQSGGDTTLNANHTLVLQGALRSGGDTRLNARVFLATLGRVDAKGDLSLGSNEIEVRAPLVTDRRLTINGKKVTIQGDLAAQNGIILNADDLLLRGTNGQLNIAGNLNLDLTGTLDLIDAVTIGGSASFNAQTAHFGGNLTVGGNLALNAGNTTLNGDLTVGSNLTLNTDTLQHSGNTAVGGNASLSVTQGLNHTGTLQTGGNLAIDTGGAVNLGTTQAGGNLSMTAQGPVSVSGNLLAAGSLEAHTEGDIQIAGNLQGNTHLNVSTTSGNLHVGGQLASGGTTALEASGDIQIADQALLLGGGTLTAGGTLELGNGGYAGADLNAQGEHIKTRGNLGVEGNLALDAASGIALNQSGSDTLIVTGSLNANTGGTLELGSGGRLETLENAHLTAGTLNNLGEIGTATDLTVDANLYNNSGDTAANGQISITGTLNNSATLYGNSVGSTGGGSNTGTIAADTTIGLTGNWGNSGTLNAANVGVSGSLGNSGTVTAGNIGVTGAFGNSGLLAGTAITVLNGGDIYNGGTLSGSSVSLNGTSLTNSGRIQSGSTLTIAVTGAVNNTLSETSTCVHPGGCVSPPENPLPDNAWQYFQQSGKIVSAGTLNISGSTLTNSGTLESGGDFSATLSGAFNNIRSANDANAGGNHGLPPEQKQASTGLITAGGSFSVNASDLTNSGIIRARDAVTLGLTGTLSNSGTEARLQGSTLNIQAAGTSNQGTLVATAGDVSLQLGGGGYSGGAGASIIAPGSITLQTGGDFSQAGGASLRADNSVTVNAGNISNAGDIAGTSNTDGPATVTLTGSGSVSHQGHIQAGSTVTLTGASYSGAGGVINSKGDVTVNSGSFYNPAYETVNALGTYTLNTAGLFVDIGSAWSNQSGQVNFGHLINYGSVNLSGGANGFIENLATTIMVDGAPPADYHASCPPELTECVAISHDIINSQASVNIGSFSGSLYNESSFASVNGGSYEAAWARLYVTWRGKNADDELVEIVTEHLAPQDPILNAGSGGSINLISPYPGVIIADDLTLTGTDLINAPPTDLDKVNEALAALGNDKGTAPPVPGGAAPILPRPDTDDAQALFNRPDTVRYSTRNPDVLLAVGAGIGLRPYTGEPARIPDWAAELNLPSGTIQAETLKIDLSGHLINLGALSVAGDTIIRAGEGMANLGKIESGAALNISTDSLLNIRGSISGNDVMLSTTAGLMNLSGQIVAENDLTLNVDGILMHQTEHGGERALLAAKQGNLNIGTGENLYIHNADIEAGHNLMASVGGVISVTAQDTTNIEATKTSVIVDTTWETTSLKAGNDLLLLSGKDISLQAVSLAAGNNLGISAGGKLSLTAVAEQHDTATLKTDYKGRSTGTRNDSQSIVHQSTDLQAGNSITLISGSDLLVEGGKAQATNNISILSSGKSEFRALVDSTSQTQDSTRRNLSIDIGWYSTGSNSLTTTQTVHGFQANAGTNLLIQGAGDVHLASVQLNAGKDLTVGSGGNLSITASTEKQATVSQAIQRPYDYFRYENAYDANDRVVTSQLAAGGNLTLSAASDLTLISVQGHAEEELNLHAGKNLTIAGSYETQTKGQNTEREIAKSIESESVSSSRYIGSSLSGNSLAVTAGKDANLIGSTLSATEDARFDITGTFRIGTGENQQITDNGTTYLSIGGGKNANTTATEILTGSLIQAGGNLAIKTGEDFSVSGSRLQAGKDLGIDAGGAITLISALDSEHKTASGVTWFKQSVTQAAVESGGSLSLNAGKDLTLSGVSVRAGETLKLNAGGDLVLGAITQTDRDFAKRHLREQNTQISTTLDAVGDIQLNAEKNIFALGGRASSREGSVYLKAGEEIALLAATSMDELETEKKSGNIFSSRKSASSTINTTVQGFEISTGSEGGIVMESKNDITLQSAKLTAGTGGIQAHAEEGKIIFDIAHESSTYSRNSNNNMIVWERTRDRGTSTDTGVDTQISTRGPINLQAGGGVEYHYAQRQGESAEDALSRTQGQAWVTDLQNREVISWNGIADSTREWDHKHSGLTPLGAVVVGTTVAIYTYGAVSSAVGTAASGTAISAGSAAGASTIAVQLGTTGAINWSDVLKNTVVAAATAGIVNAKVFDGQSLNQMAGLETAGSGSLARGELTLTQEQFYGIVGRNTVSAGLSTVIQGGSFGSSFITGFINDYGALGAKEIGSAFGNGTNPGLQTLSHMGLGGLIAGAQGDDVTAGVIGGFVESVLDNQKGSFDTRNYTNQALYTGSAMLLAGFASQLSGHDPVVAAQIAQNAAMNNRLLSQDEKDRIKAIAAGDPNVEARLVAAACAKVSCSAGYPVGSDAYNEAKQLETIGNSNALAYERDLLSQQAGLFQYSYFDKTDDFIRRYQITERAYGAVQAGGGFGIALSGSALTALGSVSCPTVVGCLVMGGGIVLAGVGADQMTAGITTVISGTQQPTLGGTLLQQIGMSPQTAELWYGTVGGLGALSAEAALARWNMNAVVQSGSKNTTNQGATNHNPTSAITDAEAGGYSYYDQFRKADGTWNWPSNEGFTGNTIQTVLPVGTKLDRYGNDKGTFLAFAGTPYEQRALAPGSMSNGYSEYVVVFPIPVELGWTAPAFGQPGKGIQIVPTFPEKVNIEWLIKNDFIRKVTP